MVRQGGARTPFFFAGCVAWAGLCACMVLYGFGSGEA